MSSSKSRRDRKLYEDLKDWAFKVKTRDKFECAICGSAEDLQAHHILEKKMFPKHMLNLDNGITLCSRHHSFSKSSAHHSSMYFILWLMKNRPFQFKKVLELLCLSIKDSESKFIKSLDFLSTI